MSAAIFEMAIYTRAELMELEKTVFLKKPGDERIEAIREIVFGWIQVDCEKACLFLQRVEKRICDAKFIELMETSKKETGFTLDEKIATIHNICDGYVSLSRTKKIQFLKNVGYATQFCNNGDYLKSVRAILDEWVKVEDRDEAEQFLDCLENTLSPQLESHDRKRPLEVKDKKELRTLLANYYEAIEKPKTRARILEIPV